jgi:hypothetical protein
MKFGKLLCTIVGATALLCAVVSTASAGKLSSSSQTLRATFPRVDFSGGFGTVECPVTVEGSFHARTIAKTPGNLTGSVTAGTVGSCTRGGATMLAETLPWHVRYTSFTGTLPSIATITANVIGVGFRIREPTFGVFCQIVSTTAEPAIMTFTREGSGRLTNARAGGVIESTCGVRGTFGASSSTLGPTGGGAITVTLI